MRPSNAAPTSSAGGAQGGELTARQAAAERRRVLDGRALAFATTVQVARLTRGFSVIEVHARRVLASQSLLLVGMLAIIHAAPRLYTTRLRLPLVVAVRVAAMTAALVIDVSLLGPAAGQAAPASGASWAGQAVDLLRAAAMLAMPVAWAHVSVGGALGLPLPPALHLLVQAAGTGLLMWRAPTACAAYVQHPANARLAGALHWVLEQVTSLLCLGTREHLAAAAQQASAADKCSAVVWAVEVSLCLLLPTLAVYRQHEAAASADAEERRHADGQRSPRQRRARRDGERQLCAGSPKLSRQHLLCRGVLRAANEWGWPLTAGVAALAAFAAATAVQPQVPA